MNFQLSNKNTVTWKNRALLIWHQFSILYCISLYLLSFHNISEILPNRGSLMLFSFRSCLRQSQWFFFTAAFPLAVYWQHLCSWQFLRPRDACPSGSQIGSLKPQETYLTTSPWKQQFSLWEAFGDPKLSLGAWMELYRRLLVMLADPKPTLSTEAWVIMPNLSRLVFHLSIGFRFTWMILFFSFIFFFLAQFKGGFN